MISLKKSIIAVVAPILLLLGSQLHAADNNNDFNSHDTREGASLFERLFAPLTRCRGQVSGSPVRLVDGAFIWSDTDIVLNGRPDLSLTRHYNAFDARDGIFGKGWSARCEKTMVRTVGYTQNDAGEAVPTLTYIYRNALGRRYNFTETTTGNFLSPDGFSDIVLSVDDNGFAQLTGQDQKIERFNALGNLVSEIDRNGNAINYTYVDGVLSSIADTNGRALSIAFDSSGHVASVTDHTGRAWQYAYNTEGTLASVTNPDSGVTQYEYVPISRPADANQYYAISQITDPSGVVVTSVTYTDTGRVETYTQGENVYTYDVRRDGFIYKTDSMSARMSYKLDEYGNKTEVWSPSSTRNPDRFAYDIDAQLTSYTDKNETEYSFEYDLLGRIITDINPDGSANYEYFENTEWVSKFTSVTGRTTSMDYDGEGNISSITGPANNSVAFTWSEEGDLLTATDPLGNAVSYSVNSIGQTISVTDPLNRTSRYGYDAIGNIITIANADSTSIAITYDVLNRPMSVTDELGQQTQYSYDKAGRLLSIVDAAGGSAQFVYDTYGRLLTETRADGTTYTNTYRTDNLVDTSTDPRGVVTQYSYDSAKRLTTTTAGRDTYRFRYDVLDRVTSASGGSATITLAYDVMSRLLSEQQGRATVSYTYNAEGELVGMDAVDEELAYDYDARGLLKTFTTPEGMHTYVHDAAGRLTAHTYPGGATAFMAYDDASQLLQQDYSALGGPNLIYSRDMLGRVVDIQGKGTSDRVYQYDDIDRLISANQEENYSYSYDALDNRLDNGNVHDAFNKLLETNDHSYAYDEAGNLISRVNKISGEQLRLEYNGFGQLDAAQIAPAVDATATLNATYGYDAFGRRGTKTVDRVSTTYQWQGSNIIAEYQGSTNTRKYRYDGGYAAAEYVVDDSAQFVLSDYLGAADSVVSKNGDVLWQGLFDPYGAPIGAAGGMDGSFEFNQRFPGQYADDETGLSYNLHRYYEPGTGRYITADPIGFEGGLNHFAYGYGSPSVYIDPTGLIVDAAIDGASLALSLNDFRNCRSIANGLLVGLDGAFLALPIVPNVTAARHLGRLDDVAKNADNLIYRGGSGTPTNLTPRPKDTGGLSANVKPLPGKNQVIDTSKLDKLCAVCDNPKTGHVSIQPKDKSQMQDWIDSRGSGTTHPFTQELMDAVIDQIKR